MQIKCHCADSNESFKIVIIAVDFLAYLDDKVGLYIQDFETAFFHLVLVLQNRTSKR